ncbi:MAG: hypothetical protein WBA46_02190 [Thermomicrobiales bacterium]
MRTRHAPTDRRWFDVLAYCCGFWGITAVLGGITLVAGIYPISTARLAGSPVSTYPIPGLILVALGAASLLCGIALKKRRTGTVLLAGALGIVQLAYLGVEELVIGFTWMLGLFAVLAFVTIVLAGWLATHQPDEGERTTDTLQDQPFT